MGGRIADLPKGDDMTQVPTAGTARPRTLRFRAALAAAKAA